eukprot:COSAG06_NODE_1432_length_9478_cov_5.092014_7_plen_103_part_00
MCICCAFSLVGDGVLTPEEIAAAATFNMGNARRQSLQELQAQATSHQSAPRQMLSRVHEAEPPVSAQRGGGGGAGESNPPSYSSQTGGHPGQGHFSWPLRLF